MLNRVITLALLLLLSAQNSTADPGLALRWNACYGDGGVINQDFACNTNNGVSVLIGSYVLPHDMPNANGNEITFDFISASPVFPEWWQYKNPGSCRTALGFFKEPPSNAVACLDWTEGQAIGGVGQYMIGVLLSPNRARLQAAVATTDLAGRPLAAGQEYFNIQVRVFHAKTLGADACSGCCVPVGIVYSALRVNTPNFPDDVDLRSGITMDANFVSWQRYMFSVQGPQLPTPPCGPVPTRSRTWSELKALYR